MFSSPTTLILGAGASFDFGAPLGEVLWRQISQQTGALSGACDASGQGTGQLLRNTRYDDPKAYAYYSEVFSLHDDPATLGAINPALNLCFKFIYPYGAFAELPWTITDAGEWIKALAVGIGLADGKGVWRLRASPRR